MKIGMTSLMGYQTILRLCLDNIKLISMLSAGLTPLDPSMRAF
jgi:hypothetical protein